MQFAASTFMPNDQSRGGSEVGFAELQLIVQIGAVLASLLEVPLV